MTAFQLAANDPALRVVASSDAPRFGTLSWRHFRDTTETEIAWLVRGLIPAGGLAVLGSTPKAGKTWLAAHLALCVATAQPFLGRFVIANPAPVHYLALEGSAPALRHRLGALARGIGVDPDGDELADALQIAYKPKGLSLTNPDAAGPYCDEVLNVGARLCIVDTARRAARIRESGEGVEDLALLQTNLRPLTDAGVTVLFAHHARKVPAAAGSWTPPLERLSGSGDWGGIVEVGLILDRRRDGTWRDCRLEVDGRDIPSHPACTITYEGDGSGPEGLVRYDDTLRVRSADADDTELARGALNAADVAAWLAGRPRVEATTTEIAEHFGVVKSTVTNTHPALRAQGVVWDEPGPRRTRHYWLASPTYASARENP